MRHIASPRVDQREGVEKELLREELGNEKVEIEIEGKVKSKKERHETRRMNDRERSSEGVDRKTINSRFFHSLRQDSSTYIVSHCPSHIYQHLSPMIVDLRCPTCISFAMFGDEKSTNTFLFGITGPRTPLVKMVSREETRADVAMKMLMNPLG
jgi:hypothetical protein